MNEGYGQYLQDLFNQKIFNLDTPLSSVLGISLGPRIPVSAKIRNKIYAGEDDISWKIQLYPVLSNGTEIREGETTDNKFCQTLATALGMNIVQEEAQLTLGILSGMEKYPGNTREIKYKIFYLTLENLEKSASFPTIVIDFDSWTNEQSGYKERKVFPETLIKYKDRDLNLGKEITLIEKNGEALWCSADVLIIDKRPSYLRTEFTVGRKFLLKEIFPDINVSQMEIIYTNTEWKPGSPLYLRRFFSKMIEVY